MNTETEETDDGVFYDPFEIDKLKERIAALENEVGETANSKLVEDHLVTLARRIAELEKRFQETEVLLLSASTSQTELHKRIAALEDNQKNLKEHVLQETNISLMHRIAALEGMCNDHRVVIEKQTELLENAGNVCKKLDQRIAVLES